MNYVRPEAKSARLSHRIKPSVLARLDMFCKRKKMNRGEVIEWLLMTRR